MKHPWQYDETAQVGTDYRSRAQAAAYDGLMRKLRNAEAETGEIRKTLALTSRSTLWEIGAGAGSVGLAIRGWTQFRKQPAIIPSDRLMAAKARLPHSPVSRRGPAKHFVISFC